MDRISLVFNLDVEDDWPPVGAESLPFERRPEGYRALDPPLFIKGLSVGDIILVDIEPVGNHVVSWRHVYKSRRTTIWLLRMRSTKSVIELLEAVLVQIRQLECNTVTFENNGICSIDVPEHVQISMVDKVLGQLDEESVAIAFPSMRHEEY